MPLEIIGTGFGRTGTLSLKLALEQLGFGRCYHMMEVSQNPGHAALWNAAHDRARNVDAPASEAPSEPKVAQRPTASEVHTAGRLASEARSGPKVAQRPAASEVHTDWDALFAGYRATVDWPSTAFWRELVAAYPDAKVIHTERPPADWYKSASSTIFQTMTRAAPPHLPPAFHEQLEMARRVVLHGVFGGRLEDEAHAIAIYEAHNQRVKREIPRERMLVYQPGEGWEPLCEFLGAAIPATPYPRVNTTEDFLTRMRPH